MQRHSCIAASAAIVAGGIALSILAGCSPASQQQFQQVSSTLVADGQLFCQAGSVLYQAGTVKVTGATAATVAEACQALTVAGVAVQAAAPVPAPAGASVVPASVAPAAAAAVDASKKPG